MQLTPTQEATAKAIISALETARFPANYGAVGHSNTDPGGLSYGRWQASLNKGTLAQLIHAYCESNGDANCRTALSPYLDRMQKRDESLIQDGDLHAILKEAGNDPVMHRIQDAFFDLKYWNRATQWCDAHGVRTPLGASIVCDGMVQGLFQTVCDQLADQGIDVKRAGEEHWFNRYVDARRKLLASSESKDVRNSVYRMDAFKTLLHHKNWDLQLPLKHIHGLTITHEGLGEIPAVGQSNSDPMPDTDEARPMPQVRLEEPEAVSTQALADLQQNISSEIQTSFERLNNRMLENQSQFGPATSARSTTRPPAPPLAQSTALSHLTKHRHPLISTTLGILTLLITTIRDFVVSFGSPVSIAKTQGAQAAGNLARMVSDWLPNNWALGARVAGIGFIAYALVRLLVLRWDVRKLRRALLQAPQ